MRIKAKPKYKNSSGLTVPSVTTALGELSKPALIKWANRMGLEGIDVDKYKDELADIGTLTHYLIISRLKEEVPDVNEFTPEQLKLAESCYRRYVDWEGRNPVKCIFAEEPLVSEIYQYGGQPDLYAVCHSDLILADFKTNARGIFPEMIYQVAAYRQLLIENGYKITKAVILRIGRGTDEGVDEKILTASEMNNGFEIFMRSLEIYKLKRGEPI
jgi:hypothetical protein